MDRPDFNSLPELPAHTIRLDCGLLVHITKQTSHEGVVPSYALASLSVPAGSRYESARNAGHNHLLEHVLARRLETEARREKRSAPFTGAVTNREYTEYSIIGGLVDIMDFLRFARTILSAIEVDASEIPPELRRVEIERLLKETVVSEAFERIALPRSLAANSVCGEQASLRDVTVADLKASHQKFYLPHLSNIVVVLPDDHAYLDNVAMVAEAARLFLSGVKSIQGRLPEGPKPEQSVAARQVSPCGPAALSAVMMGIRLPGLGSPATAEAYVVAAILGLFGDSNAGLNKELIDQGLIYEGKWGCRQYSSCGTLHFSCDITPGTESLVQEAFANELKKIARGGVFAEDLESVKARTVTMLRQAEMLNKAKDLSQFAVVFQQGRLTDTGYFMERINRVGQPELSNFVESFGQILSVRT